MFFLFGWLFSLPLERANTARGVSRSVVGTTQLTRRKLGARPIILHAGALARSDCAAAAAAATTQPRPVAARMRRRMELCRGEEGRLARASSARGGRRAVALWHAALHRSAAGAASAAGARGVRGSRSRRTRQSSSRAHPRPATQLSQGCRHSGGRGEGGGTLVRPERRPRVGEARRHRPV